MLHLIVTEHLMYRVTVALCWESVQAHQDVPEYQARFAVDGISWLTLLAVDILSHLPVCAL